MQDEQKPFVKLNNPAASVYAKVSEQIFDDDGMFSGNREHYFSCGASAFNVISASIALSGSPQPNTILDFGSGAGRVTRWFRAAMPQAEIFATDIREKDLDFCRQIFNAKTWVSGVDIDQLATVERYDLIWAGSVITHLSAEDTHRLVIKFLSWLNPNGILVFSTHGKFAFSNGEAAGFYGVADDWRKIQSDYEASGYGYADYRNSQGYGISLTSLAWLGRMVAVLPNARLLLLSERAWDDHHDVCAIQRR